VECCIFVWALGRGFPEDLCWLKREWRLKDVLGWNQRLGEFWLKDTHTKFEFGARNPSKRSCLLCVYSFLNNYALPFTFARKFIPCDVVFRSFWVFAQKSPAGMKVPPGDTSDFTQFSWVLLWTAWQWGTAASDAT